MRDCRTSLTLHEIEILILDGPNGKQPGPDGLPSAIVKRYARPLAHVFQEAWDQLADKNISDAARECLEPKKWLVIPKSDGANTVEKLRDLELGNEVRKVLARMLFKVFDEASEDESRRLSGAQQAFIRGRDIVRNTSMLCRRFWSEVEESVVGDDPFLMLQILSL